MVLIATLLPMSPLEKRFMDDSKKNLTGSPLRDTFKQLHKANCERSFYACDLDFILVRKVPEGILAFIDYKRINELITFSEVLAYNGLVLVAPLYIIRSITPEKGPFTIDRYLSGDWRPEPPIALVKRMVILKDWAALNLWEGTLRTEKN